MRKLGYARVSTSQQDLTTQIEKLVNAGVENHPDFLFTDKASGKNDDREGLQRLLTKLSKGDHLIITKLDRLGRNTADMIKIIEDLNDRGITVEFIDDCLNTKGSMGKMVITILSAVAEAERARILERTNEGRKKAKQEGKIKFGRKPTITKQTKQTILNQVAEGKLSKAEIAKINNVSRQYVYNVISKA